MDPMGKTCHEVFCGESKPGGKYGQRELRSRRSAGGWLKSLAWQRIAQRKGDLRGLPIWKLGEIKCLASQIEMADHFDQVNSSFFRRKMLAEYELQALCPSLQPPEGASMLGSFKHLKIYKLRRSGGKLSLPIIPRVAFASQSSQIESRDRLRHARP